MPWQADACQTMEEVLQSFPKSFRAFYLCGNGVRNANALSGSNSFCNPINYKNYSFNSIQSSPKKCHQVQCFMWTQCGAEKHDAEYLCPRLPSNFPSLPLQPSSWREGLQSMKFLVCICAPVLVIEDGCCAFRSEINAATLV